MDRKAGMESWFRTPFFHRTAKALIFLMVFQTWPLWELSRTYELNLGGLSSKLNQVINFLRPGEAQAGSLFGPKKYIRTTGKPNIYKDTFSATSGKGWLIILNGEEDGSHRVSAAIITFNGKDLLKTKDFNQNVYRLRTAVDLSSKNSLVVELRSKPKSYLRIEITAALPNQVPVADAGPDQTVLVDNLVTLNGSGSSDPDGDPLTYRWTFGDRPSGSAASLSDPVAVKPTFIADKAGSYTLQLIVNDGYVDSPPDTVIITTQNTPPVANAGPDQTAYVSDVVTLNGSGSTDVDGNPLTYQWSIISKPSGSMTALSDPAAVNPTLTVDKAGSYVIELIVNDGLIDSISDNVTVTTLNTPPVANAGPDQSVSVGQTVTLDGSSSTDVDGNPLTFLWSLTTWPTGSLATLSDFAALNPTFITDKSGEYVIQLIVNDGTVNSAPDTVTVTTLNSPPVANAGPDQSVLVGDVVTLDGSASTDVDGDSLTFLWALIARPTESQAVPSDAFAVRPTFVVDKPGTYVGQLIVNDGTVNSAPDTVTISTLNSFPVANAGPDQNVLVGDLVTLDGSFSFDVDGDPLTYSWSFTGRPDRSSATIVNPTAINPSFTVDKAGSYTLQLIVNDGTLNSAPDTVSITTRNSRPVANAGQDLTVPVGTEVILDGRASYDADQDPLTYQWSCTSFPGTDAPVLSNPSLVNPTFVAGLTGLYVMQLIVNDGILSSEPDTVAITVNAIPNRAPVANNDSYTIDENLTLIVATPGVLSNDSDPDGGAISAVLAGGVTHGTLSFNADGSFTYAPDPSYHGADSFTYSATDGSLFSNDATVTITIQSVNDTPIADAGENQSVATGTTVQLDGSASSDADGDILTYQWTLTSRPNGSTAVLSDPNVVNPTFFADNAGLYQVSLVVSDGAVTSSPNTITIEAATVNQSPVARDVSVNIDDTSPVNIILRGTDPDGDNLAFSTTTNPLHGILSGTPPLLTYTPESGYLGSDSFLYQADDGKGGTATATVTVNICLSTNGLVAYYPFNGNANDESGNGNNGTVYNATIMFDREGNPGSAYDFNGGTSYIEVAERDVLKMSNAMSIDVWIYPVGPGTGGAGLIVGRDGEYLVARYADGTIRWAFGNTNGWTFWYNTSWVNTGFVASLYRWTHIVVVYDSGVIKTYADGALVHTFNGSGPIVDTIGNLNTLRIGNREIYNQNYFDGLIDEVRVYNRALTEQEVMCGACTTSNKPPRITSMALTSAGIHHQYSYQVVANDPDGDPLTYNLSAAPSGMTVDSSGLIRWTPAAASDFNVIVQVSDGYGGTDSQNFWIRVGNGNSPAVNTPPMAHAGDDFTVEEGKQDQLDGSHSFDANADHLTYVWTQIGGPPVELDSHTVQKPRFTAPIVDKNTLLTFELVVNDGLADSAAAKVHVMVLNMDIWPDGSGMVINCNADGPGSLKAAVDYANSHPGTRITFSIPDTEPCYEVNTPGVWTLAVPVRQQGAYTAGILIDADGTFFDGASQTENQGDRNPYGPEIEITENNVASWPFIIAANDVVVRGIVVNRQPYMGWHSPVLRVSAGKNGVITGSYFGTDATGTIPLYNYTTDVGEYCLVVENGAGNDYSKKSLIHNLRVGGARQGEGNILSSFFGSSISISPMYDGSAYHQPLDAPGPVTIQGNLIGVDRTGSRPLLSNIIGHGITITQGKDILIGGVTSGSRNIITGSWNAINIQTVYAPYGLSGNITIQGNFIGTDITGTAALGSIASTAINMQPPVAEHDIGTEWVIGGSIPGSGNVIVSEGGAISVGDPSGAISSIKIQGNYISTDVSGTVVLSDGADGINIGGGRVLVGGTGPGEGNVIGGQVGTGIVISGVSPATPIRPSSIEVKGNRIGVGADGVTPIPNTRGVAIATGFPLVIGGTEAGAGNTIAHNLETGVWFYEQWWGNDWRGWFGRVLGNRIYDNGGRGIIRGSGRVNDPGDANYGYPLYSQNYPVIKIVEIANGTTQISGILDTPNPEQCLIEIFANREADPSGFGEGEQWIAAIYAGTDGRFSFSIPQDLSGKYLTATATRMAVRLNSSEFSPAVLAGAYASTNMPPVISSSPVISATTETAYSYQVLASDPEGQALRYALALAPEGMSINAAGLISWTPTPQQTGRQVVTVVAYDPEGLYGSQNFSILTEPAIDVVPPVISPSIPAGLTISAPYQVTGTIYDSHLVGYAIEVAPSGTDNFVLMASGDASVQNGVLGTIDPTRLSNGTYTVRFTAWDDSGNLTVFSSTEPVEIKGKLKIGQFSLAFQDISVPVSGIPINVIRSYNSFNKNQGDFGTGWDMALGTGLKVQVTRNLGTDWTAEEDYYFDRGGTGQGSWVYKLTTDKVPKVLVTYADGRQDRFEFRPDFVIQPAFAIDWVNPIYKALEGTRSRLEDLYGGAPLYLQNSQLLDLMGEDVAVYNPSEFKLTTSDGMVLIISKTEGLKSLTDRNGNTVTFSPSGIAHSAGLDISMQRDFKNRITKITDPMGKSVSYLYNANDDLAAFTDQAGNVTRYGYDINHNLTSIIDARGIQILRTQYDAEGRMIGTVDGLGNITQVVHDTANAREHVIDRRGYTTVYEYDTDGNIITQTDPLDNVTRFTYDANGNQLSRTDPLGNTWTFTYDEKDNKLSEADPLGNIKQWTYNANKQILTATDALGRVIAYGYDANGNLLRKTDAMGNVTTHAYDWRGNRTATTVCFGTTTYEYNASGYKTKETDALGNVTTYTYDSNGNQLTMTKTRTTDTGPVIMTTTKQYNSNGQLFRQTDPDGSVTVTEYNSLRKKSASVDKRGNRTTYEYDAAGNLTRTIYPNGTTEINSYDGNGNRVTYTDHAGRITTFVYDAVKYGEGEQAVQNRLIQTTFADGSSTRIEYDAAGRTAANIDENGNRTSFIYDVAGRRTTVTDAQGYVTTFTYDANGNQVTTTDANGNTTSYEYDALNRRTAVIFPDGTSTVTVYAGCSMDRKLAETDQAGNTTHFAYDALGRLTSVTDALGGITSYTYDEVGNKLTQTDPNDHTTTWSYDNMGRVTRRTLPLDMYESFTYDPNGNVLTKTDFSGSTITNTYDVMNRLTMKVYPNASQVTNTYTPTGRRASVTDSRGITTHTYGARDRLLNVTNPDGSNLDYTYDLKGNRTSVRIASGTTTYAYDSLNRLTTVTDPDAGVTIYSYDNVGNRATVTYPNGTMTEYRYNTLSRLTYLENRKTSGEVISSYAYTLGLNGNRTKVTENTGRVVDYSYDALNRLTQELITDSILGNRTIAYSYDAFGNRLTKTAGLDTTTYTYNANDQLITETAPGYTATYEYDANGNTVRKVQGATITTYVYDYENRLVGSQTDSQQVEYEYDPDGIRTRVTTGTATTKYLVDKNLMYAQVLEERDGGDSLIVSYVYGDDLISQKRGTVLSYYHYDGQMSTRKLSDSSGSVTDSYVYDAFGNLLDRTGTTVNNYLYTGEQYDPNVGFYYLRARYYNFAVGRFTSIDPYQGNIYDPMSLHRYTYVQNSPISNWDPTGEVTFTLIQAMIVVGIVGVLSSLSYLALTSKATGPTWTDLVIAGLFGIASSLLALAIVAPVTLPLAGGIMVGAEIYPVGAAFAIREGPRFINKLMEGKAGQVASDLAGLARMGASDCLRALNIWCSAAIQSPQMQSASQAVTQAFVSLQKMSGSPYGGFYNPNWPL